MLVLEKRNAPVEDTPSCTAHILLQTDRQTHTQVYSSMPAQASSLTRMSGCTDAKPRNADTRDPQQQTTIKNIKITLFLTA